MTKLTKHHVITIIPFLMLFVTALSGVFSSYEFYKKIQPFLGDSIGYSITTNIVFIFLYFRKSFCYQTKIAVLGLLIMNIISLIFSASETWIYNKMYDIWLSLIIFAIIVLNMFNIKKQINRFIRWF
jgi:hypothetical protein